MVKKRTGKRKEGAGALAGLWFEMHQTKQRKDRGGKRAASHVRLRNCVHEGTTIDDGEKMREWKKQLDGGRPFLEKNSTKGKG